MPRSLLIAAVAAATLIAAGPAATAGSPAPDPGPTAQAAKTYRLAADSSGRLRFKPSRITASRGSVTLRMANPSSLPHAIAIRNRSGRTVLRGGTSTVTVRLGAGAYTYFCPVGGHRAAGMTGRLVVR